MTAVTVMIFFFCPAKAQVAKTIKQVSHQLANEINLQHRRNKGYLLQTATKKTEILPDSSSTNGLTKKSKLAKVKGE